MSLKFFACNMRKIWFYALYSIAGISILTGCLPKDVTSVESDVSKSYEGFKGIESAETINDTRVLLKWSASSDSNVVAYNIYDATFKFSPKLIRTVAAPATQVTINGLAPQSLYAFRVRAANDKNEEDTNTEDLNAVPYSGITTAQVLSSTSARLNFTPAENVDEVVVFCKAGDNAQYEQVATVRNLNHSYANVADLTPGILYTCRAAVTVDGFTDNNSATVQFTPMGQASRIVFTTNPSNTSAGSLLNNQPVITILDANDNVVAGGPDSTAEISLNIAVASPTAGIINGTTIIRAVAGVATFSDLKINESGVKILSATKEDTSAQEFGTAPMSVNSTNFTISPGSASPDYSEILVSTDPVSADPLVADGSAAYIVSIYLRDAYGNPISGVRPQFVSNVSGDTLVQPTQNTNSLGVTTGSLSTTKADTPPSVVRSINISSPPGLSTVTRLAPFVHGPAKKLSFSQQPVTSPAGIMGMGPVQVAIQDQFGNTITSGSGSDAEVTLTIQSIGNGASLTGTNVKVASGGLVSFNDLGIDMTGVGYKLIANAASYVPVLDQAYSNAFNITAGIPRKIAITGPADTLSGACSTVVSVKLQDLGNNPANAIQNTPVTLTGLGNASLYTASNCSGTAMSTTLTFSAGQNTRTFYMRNNSAQAITLTATDPSAVMSTGTLNATFSPSKVGLLAQAAAPAPALTPLSVVAGQCSTAITITPMGENGLPGPTFAPTVVSLTGLGASPAQLFSDAACTQLVNPISITLPINSGPNYSTSIYMKNNKAEVLTLSVSDPNGILQTTTGPQGVTITPSQIYWTGPTTVVAGMCSSVFAVNLRDVIPNNVTALQDTTLTINGVPELSSGRFYTNASCTGGGVFSSVTFPQSQNILNLYFKSDSSGTYNLSLSDPASQMSASTTIQMKVSPSALRISAPVGGPANIHDTSVCAGPFLVETLDSLAQVSNAVSTITANLTGAGVAGGFYSNSQCTAAITSVSFLEGESQKSIYYLGHYPETSLTFAATDVANILTPDDVGWSVVGKPAWVGTAATDVDGSNNPLWFRTGAKPVAARYDGVFSATRLAFSPTHQYLYVTDWDNDRILKYDYTNHTYIGWIGGFRLVGGIGITKSNLPTPSNAQCASTLNNTATPGWCVGGQSQASSNNAQGQLYDPEGIVDDGNYIYVANRNGHSVSRFNSQTGAFEGFIGYITNNSGMVAATGGPAECSTAGANIPTPGWCRGGANGASDANPLLGDGRLARPRDVAFDNDYLYVLNRSSITRYDKATGVFTGWIGRVSTTPTGGDPGCTGVVAGQQTPGWCTGGASTDVYMLTGDPGGIDTANSGIYVIGSTIHAVRSNGAIMRYDKDTGAVIGTLPSLTYNWITTGQMTTDGSYFYFADNDRILKTDLNGLVESWIGKVENNNSMSGNPGCATLAVNDNTPGWCLGGTARPGFDEGSFRQMQAIAYDGVGGLLVGLGGGAGVVRRYNIATGLYEGTLSLESTSPQYWSNNAVMVSQRNGFDSDSYFNPMGIAVQGDDLFVVDYSASRVKKISRKTGFLDGMVGAITSRPTGGLIPGCLTANPFAASPGWCKGGDFLPNALFWDASMINTTANGIFHSPTDIAANGTHIFITDYNLHRVVRFNISTGVSDGWIGRIAVSPTGGAPGCIGAAVGTFTPGWCTGGRSQSGTGDGHLNLPVGITIIGSNIYVADRGNERVSSYNITTGAFNGWIGRIGTPPTSGCTVGNNGNYDVSTSGWCLGGTSAEASNLDRGGGFNFWGNNAGAGLTTDGTYLYVANFIANRIDRYATDGTFQGSVRTRDDIYTNTWTTDPDIIGTMGSVGCSYPMSIWTDGTHMYGTSHQPCQRNGDSFNVWKMDLATGTMIGWQGGINAGNLPYDGDPGCAGATERTPGWCRGGQTTMGRRLGQFSGTVGFITGDSHFIYVTDQTGNRVTRFPK